MKKIDSETRTCVMIHLAVHVLKCPWVVDQEYLDYNNTFLGFSPHENGRTPIMIPEYWNPFYSFAANEDIVYRFDDLFMNKKNGEWLCVILGNNNQYWHYQHKSRLYAVCMAAAIATGFELPDDEL